MKSNQHGFKFWLWVSGGLVDELNNKIYLQVVVNAAAVKVDQGPGTRTFSCPPSC